MGLLEPVQKISLFMIDFIMERKEAMDGFLEVSFEKELNKEIPKFKRGLKRRFRKDSNSFAQTKRNLNIHIFNS